jgi:hypothetical protein
MGPELSTREFREGVAFRDFRIIAAREGWTVESILERVGRGMFGAPASSPFYEPPNAYLARVLRKGHAIDDDYVIPYGCLITLYVEATRFAKAIGEPLRRCPCGCGSPVFGHRRYAASGCRRRAQRRNRLREVPASA